MRIYFHWHSFVKFFHENCILIDPFITNNNLCDIDIFELKKLNIESIILTHLHNDHIWDSVEMIKNIPSIKLISTFEIISYFKKIFPKLNAHAMHIWWEHNFWEYSIKFVNAVHWWATYISNQLVVSYPVWVVVRSNWYSVYHAWDTWLTYDMKLLSEFDNINLAFLPIWWNFTMWVDDAVIATSFIQPDIVVPIHYNTFDIIKADPLDFSKKVLLKNLSSPKILNPWQYIHLD